MAYTIEEIGRKFRVGDPPSGTQKWQIRDVPDEALAYALLTASAPMIWQGLIKQRLEVEEVGGNVWMGTVHYGTRPPATVGETTWSWDLSGGGLIHINQGLGTASSVVDAGTAPDFKNAINVRHDGNGLVVDGLDIDSSVFDWSETHYLAATSLTEAYFNTLFELRGKTNDDFFRIFASEEVRFRGASGQCRGFQSRAPEADEVVPVTFSFSASLHRVDIPIGGLTLPTKKGWHYAWTYHKVVEDTTAYELVSQPRAAYSEKIFETGDFAGLNIPNPWTVGT